MRNDLQPFVLPQLPALQALRGNPVIVFSSVIDDDAVPILYEFLEEMGRTSRLDLVVSTIGGSVTSARRIALLLREYVDVLTILVPHRAASAGTLLCLSANELVMGPISELSPIDPGIGSLLPPADAPDVISAQDIQTFPEMAAEWFGVNRERDRLQVLALVAQRIFPPSLSSFYRSDRLCRQAAQELLHYQLPDVDDAARDKIADRLIRGYGAHDHVITRTEAKALGLRVNFGSRQEASLLWELLKTCRRQFLKQPGQPGEDGITGLIMSLSSCASRVQRWVDDPGREGERGGEAAPQLRVPRISWTIGEQPSDGEL